jgi:hypothetical protein
VGGGRCRPSAFRESFLQGPHHHLRSERIFERLSQTVCTMQIKDELRLVLLVTTAWDLPSPVSKVSSFVLDVDI